MEGSRMMRGGVWLIGALWLLALGCQGGPPLRGAEPRPMSPPDTGARTLQREAPVETVVLPRQPDAATTSPPGEPLDEVPPPEVLKPTEPEALTEAPEADTLDPPPEGADLTTWYPLPKRERRVKRGELELLAINTGERKRVRLYDNKGRQRSAAVRQLTRVCRDHRRNRTRNMDRRLAAILYAIGQAYGRPLHLVSGYRVPTRRDRRRRRRGKQASRHGSGEAADIRVPGVPPQELAYFIRANFERVGGGYYPTSEFVHVDVRSTSYYWVDFSGPGERQQLKSLPIEPAPKRGSDWTVKSSRRLPKAMRP
ncbi:MAG: hypothetical protein CMH57_07845 [Myxococcales bacterium]|nr:hypothetical protein [Myxococcales bacterium]